MSPEPCDPVPKPLASHVDRHPQACPKVACPQTQQSILHVWRASAADCNAPGTRTQCVCSAQAFGAGREEGVRARSHVDAEGAPQPATALRSSYSHTHSPPALWNDACVSASCVFRGANTACLRTCNHWSFDRFLPLSVVRLPSSTRISSSCPLTSRSTGRSRSFATPARRVCGGVEAEGTVPAASSGGERRLCWFG